MWIYALVAGIILSLGLSCATPLHDTVPDLPILVPDTGIIDSSSLKVYSAEKFLSLWFIYVLTGKVLVSDQPSTMLIPLNSKLPKDPTTLSDNELMKEILLNHVVLGDSILLDAAEPTGEIYYSLADSELVFTKEADSVYVNGVRLTGERLDFGNVRIYIVEDIVPFLESEFFDFLSDFPPKDATTIVKFPAKINSTISDTNSNLVTSPMKKEVIFNEELEMDVEILTKKEENEEKESVPKITTTMMRPTRFEKFRIAPKFREIKTENIPKTTKSPTKITKSATKMTNSPTKMTNSRTKITKSPTKMTKSPTKTIPATLSIEETTISGVNEEEFSVLFPTDLNFNSEFVEKVDFNNNFDSDVEFFGEFLRDEPLVEVDVPFSESLLLELDVPNSRASEFVNHFRKIHLDQYLKPDSNYTVIIPTNGAFYNYYPIDWGFNPFLVENFTKDVLLNHFMEGDIDLQHFNDSVEIQTIAGRLIRVNKQIDGKLVVNGNVIPAEFEINIPRGRLYYVDEMLFVDYDRVNRLRDQNPWIETAPLISFPWPTAPFLSHLLRKLQENNETKIFAHLLKNSDISRLVSSSDANLNRLNYTAFVPTDAALGKTFDAEKLSVLDTKSINDFLLGHLVSGYLFRKDFENGFNLVTLSNNLLPITSNHEGITLKGSKIIGSEEYVYNLGSIFIIDGPLKQIEHHYMNVDTDKQLIEDVEIVPLDAEDSVTEAAITYEVRTEISYSRQINNGIIEPVSKDVIDRAKRTRNIDP